MLNVKIVVVISIIDTILFSREVIKICKGETINVPTWISKTQIVVVVLHSFMSILFHKRKTQNAREIQLSKGIFPRNWKLHVKFQMLYSSHIGIIGPQA